LASGSAGRAIGKSRWFCRSDSKIILRTLNPPIALLFTVRGIRESTALKVILAGCWLCLTWQRRSRSSCRRLRIPQLRHFHDTLDHVVALTDGTSYEDWNFGLSQVFALTQIRSSRPLFCKTGRTWVLPKRPIRTRNGLSFRSKKPRLATKQAGRENSRRTVKIKTWKISPERKRYPRVSDRTVCFGPPGARLSDLTCNFS